MTVGEFIKRLKEYDKNAKIRRVFISTNYEGDDCIYAIGITDRDGLWKNIKFHTIPEKAYPDWVKNKIIRFS